MAGFLDHGLFSVPTHKGRVPTLSNKMGNFQQSYQVSERRENSRYVMQVDILCRYLVHSLTGLSIQRLMHSMQ